MGSVNLRGVTKVFGTGGGNEVVAVSDADLEVADGEFVVFVGPSGSGKSTMLRCVAGLEEVTEGEIHVDDEEITDVNPKNRDVAMVFQNYALYPHLTARGNMSFGLKMQGGISKEEIDRRVEEAASVMEITDELDSMPSELSGGQKQRVALGRAIVRDPEVFLMDEPLSNLDAKLRSTMRTEIQRLQNDLGVTTIYVTHDQTEAMTMGDRIVIMRDAEIQQIATPMEAYYGPANRFVAGFIGSPSMNFVEVVVDRTGTPTFEHPAFSVPVSDLLTDPIPADADDVLVGIRPEDILVADAESPRSIEVTVDVVEPLGKEVLVYFDLGEETYTASISDRREVQEGTTISLEFPEEQVHLFDTATEETIKNCEDTDERDLAPVESP
jgi:multiple sugar transport system ATP-binding protein